ncbi:MAG TPA: hypothetical protein VGO78_09090 [Acidimicrobiales bacterium]|nr:hypothetical protein [Acidimicrobiales bacterium]
MHPTLALSVVLLSWCFFRNRTMGTRTLFAASLALLGWEPATAGNQAGMVLILIAVGLAVSVLWDMAADLVPARRRTRPGAAGVPAPAAPPPAPSAPTPRPTVPPPTGAVRAQPSPPPAPATATAFDRFTELERADAFGDLLEANLAGLVDAYKSGDVRAQAAFAGEIADVARGMETMLRVVVGERHRVSGIDATRPDGLY